MATISGVSLSPTKSGANVKLKVEYTLTPNRVEKLAGSVFKEEVELLAEDGNTSPLLSNFVRQTFAVSEQTPTVLRTREFVVAKSLINEDAGTDPTGSELRDEILAKVTLTYAANEPTNPGTLDPAFSGVVTGFWK